MSKLKLTLLLLISLSYASLYAQPGNPIFGLTGTTLFDVDIRPIAIVDLETTGASSNFTITLSAPNEAGSPIGSNPLYTNNENWINYSCANPSVGSRHIEAQITSGSVPAGFELRLDISTSLTGGGTLGSPAPSTVTLSGTSQSIITGIQSAFTGDGASNGHQLTFSLHYLSGSYSSIIHQTTAPIVITYTIVDD